MVPGETLEGCGDGVVGRCIQTREGIKEDIANTWDVCENVEGRIEEYLVEGELTQEELEVGVPGGPFDDGK